MPGTNFKVSCLMLDEISQLLAMAREKAETDERFLMSRECGRIEDLIDPMVAEWRRKHAKDSAKGEAEDSIYISITI